MLRKYYICILFLLCICQLTEGFDGVLRYLNGTDVELRKWYKDIQRCGEDNILTNNDLIIFNDTQCGYACNWKNGEPHSSYKAVSGGGLSCENDKIIRESSTCANGTIGYTTSITNQIPIFSLDQLETKQTLLYKGRQLSRCNFTDSCTKVKYLDAFSGWRDTSLHTCFDVSTSSNFTHPAAELSVSCSTAKKSQLTGQIFRIQSKCHIDADRRDYDVCFLLKIAGKYLVSNSNEDLKKSCAVIPPVITSTTMSPTQASTSHDDDFLIPYGIIIIVTSVIIIIAIVILIWCCCKGSKKTSQEKVTANGVENGVVRLDQYPDEKNNNKRKWSMPFAFHNSAFVSSIRETKDEREDKDDDFVIPENIEPVFRPLGDQDPHTPKATPNSKITRKAELYQAKYLTDSMRAKKSPFDSSKFEDFKGVQNEYLMTIAVTVQNQEKAKTLLRLIWT